MPGLDGEIDNGLVSIVMPAYNAAEFIDRTIASIISQNYQNWELIVINDGSKDDTLTILEKWVKEDTRINVYNQENQGVSAARNHGIRLSKGKYVAFFDADDIMHSDNISLKINALITNDADWAYSNMNIINGNDKFMNKSPKGRGDNLLENILLWTGEVVPGPCSNIIIKNIFTTTSLNFKIELSTSADQQFCIDICKLKLKPVFIDQYLWSYRVFGSNMHTNIDLMEKDEILIYKWAKKDNLFKDKKMERLAFSKMYMVLGKSWWKVGNNKAKGIKWIIKSLIKRPANILQLRF